MAKVIAGMTVSLDGFVEDESGSADPLYPDLEALQGSDYMNALIDETGAVIMGRRTFAMADDPDWFVGNPKQDEHLTFTFVTAGVESAVAQARAAAGDKAVAVIGGASVNQQLLRADLVDELHIDVMPVLLGAGLRLFENVDAERVELEKIGVQEVGARTSLRYRVKR